MIARSSTQASPLASYKLIKARGTVASRVPVLAIVACSSSSGRFKFFGVAVIQPDVSQASGISELRRIAAHAETYDVTVAPHCPLGPITLAASLQLDFAIPNFLIQEQSITFFGDRFLQYVTDPSVFDFHEGSWRRPLGPGLGIEVDEEVVERLAEIGHDHKQPIWWHTDGSYAEF